MFNFFVGQAKLLSNALVAQGGEETGGDVIVIVIVSQTFGPKAMRIPQGEWRCAQTPH